MQSVCGCSAALARKDWLGAAPDRLYGWWGAGECMPSTGPVSRARWRFPLPAALGLESWAEVARKAMAWV